MKWPLQNFAPKPRQVELAWAALSTNTGSIKLSNLRQQHTSFRQQHTTQGMKNALNHYQWWAALST